VVVRQWGGHQAVVVGGGNVAVIVGGGEGGWGGPCGPQSGVVVFVGGWWVMEWVVVVVGLREALGCLGVRGRSWLQDSGCVW
jgi:hypothetical protein